MWADPNDLPIKRKAILKADLDCLLSSWSNQPFCKGTIHIIVRFHWNFKLVSFWNGCNSGVCGPIWMIFISKERYESVKFEYQKQVSMIYCHHGIISHFVRIPFTLLFIFTKSTKDCHFQIIVSPEFVDPLGWYSYQQKGIDL